jgi:hypothetical protein
MDGTDAEKSRGNVTGNGSAAHGMDLQIGLRVVHIYPWSLTIDVLRRRL